MEWIETTVGEFCPFSYGKSLPQSKRIEGNYPVYGSNGIVGFHKEPNIKSHGIIIGRKGSIGEIHLSLTPFWAIDTSFYTVKESLPELKFTYYLLKTLGLNTMNSDSAVPGLNRDNAHSIKIKIPKLQSDREKIAEFLSTFDQKITLNTQTNQTLEQIAQAIFKHWFIDFAPVHAKANALVRGETIEQAELVAMACLSGKTVEKITALKTEDPTAYHQLQQTARAFPSEFVESEMGLVPKGWEQTTLSQICEMKNGYAFKSKEWTNDGVPVIKIGSVKPMLIELDGGSFVALENKKLRADFLAQEGDILVGLTGYVGEVGRMPYQEKAMINQRVAKFIPKEITKNTPYYGFIYCLTRQKEFKTFAEMNAKGSAQANISTKEILSYPITIATKEIHIAFENNVKSLLDKIIVNSGENSSLTKTRDELLPKLLNGEVEL
ncbi:restriction endonuclease subunit S [Avibacterium paragallinarum]|uniref:restriction endonuclease subunit S n=1 Tax=Avibacterium paragallinarum TaxID=728 RepID=UPI00397A812A